MSNVSKSDANTDNDGITVTPANKGGNTATSAAIAYFRSATSDQATSISKGITAQQKFAMAALTLHHETTNDIVPMHGGGKLAAFHELSPFNGGKAFSLDARNAFITHAMHTFKITTPPLGDKTNPDTIIARKAFDATRASFVRGMEFANDLVGGGTAEVTPINEVMSWWNASKGMFSVKATKLLFRDAVFMGALGKTVEHNDGHMMLLDGTPFYVLRGVSDVTACAATAIQLREAAKSHRGTKQLVPVLDDKGQPKINKNGKPAMEVKFVPTEPVKLRQDKPKAAAKPSATPINAAAMSTNVAPVILADSIGGTIADNATPGSNLLSLGQHMTKINEILDPYQKETPVPAWDELPANLQYGLTDILEFHIAAFVAQIELTTDPALKARLMASMGEMYALKATKDMLAAHKAAA